MDKRLDGRVAIVTGGASGIGFACVKRYAQEGAAVVALDLNAPAEWEQIEALTERRRFFQCDVTDLAAQQAIVADVVAEFGAVDILVTSAGIGDAGPVHLVEEDAWRRVLDINLTGTFLSAKAVLPQMMEQRRGSIITIASCEGVIASEGGSSYNAAKAGVINLTRNIAMDYGRMGIRANALCPGFIQTPLFDSVMELIPDIKSSIEAQSKLGRFGRPEEMAGMAFFLASDDSSYVTGQAMVADGGYTAGPGHGIVDLMGLG